ncbi:dnaJ homolog subfamily C member 24-like [Belonocnema kinseyi]|uniref:dnaJ homolog subfamily C member 24-like n=1 Tax=Belonocnema kinseyi TaxID=2817044 RepID=UPI00143D742C|nr:dnaJ homolog subfamily C member 24-like [Belonocnema kinseyi]
MSEKDYYEVLGCHEEASHEDIKRVYREQALKNHPDKMKDSKQSAEKFHQIQEAWEILGDSDSRRIYDAERKQAQLEAESILLFARITSDELYSKNGSFAYQCRCGSEYIVDKKDLEIYEQLTVACDECTFSIFIEVNKTTNLTSQDSTGT